MARVTGLEITETSVRVTELDGSPRKYRVVGAAEIGLEPGNREVPEAVSQAVRAAFKAAKAKKDQVIVGIPSREAVIREILIPFTDTEQIRKVIKFESEGHLHGIDIEDVVVDFQKVGESGPRSRVLIIAIKKSAVRRYLELLGRAGVDPHQVDLDSAALFSLSQLIPEVEEFGDQGQVILDVGTVTSSVIVSEHRHLRMVRCMRLGSETLTRTLAKDLEIEPEEARKVTQELLQLDEPFGVEPGTSSPSTALTSGQLRQDIIKDKEHEFEQRVISEISRSLSSIQMEGKLGAIWLTGPASTAPSLEAALKRAFGVHVAQLATLDPAESHKLPESASLYVGTGCGLALKGLGHDPMALDFRQEELRFTRKFERVQIPLFVMGLFLFLGLAFLTINSYLTVRSHEKLIDRIGRDALTQFEKNLVAPAVADPSLREILGYENREEVKTLVPEVQAGRSSAWVGLVLRHLRDPADHIQSKYNLAVGGDAVAGPEASVTSALVRIDAFAKAFRRAQPRLGRAMIDTFHISPTEIRFDMRMEKVNTWNDLDRELKSIPGYVKAESGKQSFWEGNLYQLKGCRVVFEREQ